jgi:hypothetical protein
MNEKFKIDKVWIAIKEEPKVNEEKYEVLVEKNVLRYEMPYTFTSVRTGKPVEADEVSSDDLMTAGWNKKAGIMIHPVYPHQIGYNKGSEYVTTKELLIYEKKLNKEFFRNKKDQEAER